MEEKVKAEFVNTESEFKWRLVYGNESSPWTNWYQGILTWRFSNGKLYGLATDYWKGSLHCLPVEVPFEIIEIK